MPDAKCDMYNEIIILTFAYCDMHNEKYTIQYMMQDAQGNIHYTNSIIHISLCISIQITLFISHFVYYNCSEKGI